MAVKHFCDECQREFDANHSDSIGVTRGYPNNPSRGEFCSINCMLKWIKQFVGKDWVITQPS